MHRAPAIRVIAAAGALSVFNAVLLAGAASAGQFTVASCQADRAGFSTTAFNDFATRGMTIKRACNPEGPGIRGLVTANATRRGRVPRGSVALVAISAPAGTRFTTFRWAGSARRTDCRYSLQLYAAGPDIKPVPIKNVRANRRCPRPARAQAAGYRSRRFDVTGATRIVQRVICVGGNGRRSCSARRANYIRTYQAEAGVLDEQLPAAAISPNAPLTTGAWVAGSQAAELRRRGQRGGAAGSSDRLRPSRWNGLARMRRRHGGRRVHEQRALPERTGADHREDDRAHRRNAATRRPASGRRWQHRGICSRHGAHRQRCSGAGHRRDRAW